MVINNDITIIGKTTFRSQMKDFGIKLDDRRRHMYIVGKTGMGKSILLENMAIQDILAGRGLAFVDPHGEVAEDLLHYIPRHRINDVIYFDPSDWEFPIAFNIMEETNPTNRHLVAAGLMSVFKKIWPDVWSARMEYILNNTILALLEYPNATLLGIHRMLADGEYRRKVVENVKDPVVKSFWLNEFARYTQSYEIEATAAIQNKVGQFVTNSLIRNIVGQTKTKINMREIMDKRKILIANLSKGRLGEDNSKLLGALLITKLQLAAMSRVDIPEEKREDFFLYVDEFQNFATEAFVSILSEARKYRLSLVLAHQYLAQLDEMTPLGKTTRVREAVFGNVGTIILFRVGAEDAEFLIEEFKPEFTVEDLVNLPKYNICIKLMINGITSNPFSATTLPLAQKPKESYKNMIIQMSREKYGVHFTIVEEDIKRWLEKEVSAQPLTPSKPTLYSATCSMCSKPIKVPFVPDPSKEIYCRSCLSRKAQEKTISLRSLKPIFEKPKEKKEADIDSLKKILKEALHENKENENNKSPKT